MAVPCPCAAGFVRTFGGLIDWCRSADPSIVYANTLCLIAPLGLELAALSTVEFVMERCHSRSLFCLAAPLGCKPVLLALLRVPRWLICQGAGAAKRLGCGCSSPVCGWLCEDL